MVVSTPAKLSSVIAEFAGGNCLTGNITAQGGGLTCLSAFAGLANAPVGPIKLPPTNTLTANGANVQPTATGGSWTVGNFDAGIGALPSLQIQVPSVANGGPPAGTYNVTAHTETAPQFELHGYPPVTINQSATGGFMVIFNFVTAPARYNPINTFTGANGPFPNQQPESAIAALERTTSITLTSTDQSEIFEFARCDPVWEENLNDAGGVVGAGFRAYTLSMDRGISDITIPFNSDTSAGSFNLDGSFNAATNTSNPDWDDYVINRQAGGFANPGQGEGCYSSNLSSTYLDNTSNTVQAISPQTRSALPTITTGDYAHGRASIEVNYHTLAATFAGVFLFMRDERGWIYWGDGPRGLGSATGTTLRAGTDFTEPRSAATNPTWFTSVILTDHNGNTLTLNPTDFTLQDDVDIADGGKNVASREWYWFPSSAAAWGNFNPRRTGNVGDPFNPGDFAWSTGDVTITINGYPA